MTNSKSLTKQGLLNVKDVSIDMLLDLSEMKWFDYENNEWKPVVDINPKMGSLRKL